MRGSLSDEEIGWNIWLDLSLQIFMESDYQVAKDIFRSRFNPQDGPDLYVDLAERSQNPEKWDYQFNFWGDIIKKWGVECGIIEFSLSKLSEALIWKNVFPPLHRIIDNLVQSKIIKPKEDYLSPKSFLRSITTKILGMVISSSQDKVDSYVFVSNVKLTIKAMIQKLQDNAFNSYDMVITQNQLAQELKINNEILLTELNRTPNVMRFPNGYYIQTDNFEKIDKKTAECVLNLKYQMNSSLEKIDELDKDAHKWHEKARTYVKQKRINEAKRCLRLQKQCEKRMDIQNQMVMKNQELLNQLNDIETNKQYIEVMKSITQFSKNLPSTSDVDQIMDDTAEAQDLINETNQIFTIANQANQIDDDVLEQELEELMNQGEAPSHPAPTSNFSNPGFNYQTVQNARKPTLVRPYKA